MKLGNKSMVDQKKKRKQIKENRETSCWKIVKSNDMIQGM